MLGDLIDGYGEKYAKAAGRTKAATHAMLKRELGDVKLARRARHWGIHAPG
jgi:hypothetical protein